MEREYRKLNEDHELTLADAAEFVDLTEVDDDDEPVGRILTRREIMALGSAGILLGLAGKGVSLQTTEGQTKTANLVATPSLTEGPFFVDTKQERRDLKGKTERETVLKGAPLVLAVTVYGQVGKEWKPLKGAYVDLWQCDTVGAYSGVRPSPIQREDTSGQDWLRGYQKTDDSGVARFETVYPGCYRGRTTHIHFKVRTYSAEGNVTREFTSQFFFDDVVSDELFKQEIYARAPRGVWNRNDGIYSERQADGTVAGKHLTLEAKKDGKGGYVTSFAIALVME